MAMPATSGKWTAEMLRHLPDDGRRYEIIHGELFVNPSPSWRHGDAVLQLVIRIGRFLEEHVVAHLKIAPQDVEFTEHTVVQPDLFVVPLVEGRPPRDWHEARSMLLAVEVLSPSTARRDRVVKRSVYQQEGVREYWVVDVNARVIERWRPGDERPEILGQSIEWWPDVGHPSLVIDLARYFDDVAGDDEE